MGICTRTARLLRVKQSRDHKASAYLTVGGQLC